MTDQLREELAFSGRDGAPVPDADIQESLRRIQEAEEQEEGE